MFRLPEKGHADRIQIHAVQMESYILTAPEQRKENFQQIPGGIMETLIDKRFMTTTSQIADLL